MQLRDYQRAALDSTLAVLREKQAALIVLATGLGKTVIAAHVADAFKERGRILLLAHREELIFQGRSTLERVTGEAAEIEMAGEWASKSIWGSGVVVSTIQTQIAGHEGGPRGSRAAGAGDSAACADAAKPARCRATRIYATGIVPERIMRS